ncbi:MAG: amidohydrolase family protein [Proteobacteria bacterium]|nr:amidohydrolase family protein [Pseudomonadota bacterium]
MRHVLFLVTALAFVPVVAAGETRSYSMIHGEHVIGYERVETTGDNAWSVTTRMDDNARGAKLDAVYRADAGGRPVRIEIKGMNAYPAKVEERFEIGDGQARWQTRFDRGEVLDAGNAFYLAADGTVLDYELLARRLLDNDAGHSIPLYPTGEARGETLRRLDIEGTPYTLLAIHGLSTEPVLVWLDNKERLVASLFGRNSGLVRDDVRRHLHKFGDAQQAIAESRAADRVARFREVENGLLIFRDVNVFDARNAETLPDRDVLVFNGRITDVRATGGALPDDARVMEGRNATLLPGLWDVHAHSYERASGFMHVAFGVTSVREAGGNPEDVLDIRDAFAAGEAIGPRQVLAGFVEGDSPFAARNGKIAKALDEALAWVDWYADRGFAQIKIYNSIKPEWVAPMADRAHRRGMRVSGHVPAFMIAEDAIRAGFDELNHINMVMLNFLLEEGDDTRTMLRIHALGERAGSLDIDSLRVRNFLRELTERDVAVDPTLRMFIGMMLARPGKLDPTQEYFVERMPARWQRQAYAPFMEVPPEQDENYRAAARKMRDMMKLLHAEGVTLMPGTDRAPGYGLHGELIEWARSGIPPGDVLRAATFVPARVFGLAHDFGTIERGKVADLVLVDGDPVNHIEELRNIRLVMQGTNLYDAPAMLRSMSIKP